MALPPPPRIALAIPILDRDDDECTQLSERDLLEVERRPPPRTHRYVALSIPALLDEQGDAGPSPAGRIASAFMALTACTIIAMALAVAFVR